jgi:uncharacterized protein (UPF0305 family)
MGLIHMRKSEIFKDLHNRLTCLLKDLTFADARLLRITQNKGSIEDAIASYNFAVSEEMLHMQVSSINGVFSPEILSHFKKNLSSYWEKNGPAHDEYKKYAFIICEYLAIVTQKPFHPFYIRHFKNNPPKDTAHHWYCAFKREYIKEPYSLCRFCNRSAWPDKTAETSMSHVKILNNKRIQP